MTNLDEMIEKIKKTEPKHGTQNVRRIRRND